MENDNSNPSLDKYFSGSEARDNFFDQISPPSNSAMMTSMIESKSTQDLFTPDKPKVTKKGGDSQRSPSTAVEPPSSEAEPVVCKIFSHESTSDNSFFDMISPSDENKETVDSIGFDPINEGPYPSPLQGFEDTADVLNGAESDRTRDAWIPSESTRVALIKAATSPSGAYAPDKKMLTMPGVVLETELVDQTGHLLKTLYGPDSEMLSLRKVLTVNDVSHDEQGLRELIQADCYRAAINLTGKLLAIFGQGARKQGEPSRHTVQTIQLWFTRLCLLVKLRAFRAAEAEGNIWWDLDRPDLYYQFYPERYGSRLGTMVPFQMRLLIATLPAYVGNSNESLDRLYSILAVVKRILTNLEEGRVEDGSQIELSTKEREMCKQVWRSREARVQHSLANVALMANKFELAIEILQNLISNNRSTNQKRALQSALGRVLLRLGDIANADQCFLAAKQLRRTQLDSSPSTPDVRELVDSGLLHIAQNLFEDAYKSFEMALHVEPTNPMIVNNMSICLLHMGKLKQAVQLMTSTVRSNKTALHESLLLNLTTMYELESSPLSNKEVLLKLVSQFKGDSFDVSCLKLAPAVK